MNKFDPQQDLGLVHVPTNENLADWYIKSWRVPEKGHCSLHGLKQREDANLQAVAYSEGAFT